MGQYEKVYDELLTKAKAANPKLKLVLCGPFALPVGRKREGYAEWKAGIDKRREIVARRGGGAGGRRVLDLGRGHPTYRGHQLMADEWERAVREFWK